MSNRVLFLILLLPFMTAAQNSTGITFQNKNWEALLTQARDEKKIIFVDAYATWCGPCKAMAADVFTDSEVGAFFNRNFINVKIDMEAGKGLELAERYAVESYPTFLFISGDGTLLHKAIGYQDAEQFIGTGRDALDPNRQFYSLREKFRRGGLTGEPLFVLAKQAFELEDPDAGLFAETYLKADKNCLTKNCIELMLLAANDPSSPYFTFVSKNESKAYDIAGKETVRDGLTRIAYQKVMASKVIGENDPIFTKVMKMEAEMIKYRPAREARRFALTYGRYLAREEENVKVSKQLELTYVREFYQEMSWKELNEIAWQAYLDETDRLKLLEAVTWALQSVSKDSNFFNNDTVAHLYHKLGKLNDARTYAEAAIRMGRASGADVSETEKLLKALN
jgi:thioredoxin-related protein